MQPTKFCTARLPAWGIFLSQTPSSAPKKPGTGHGVGAADGSTVHSKYNMIQEKGFAQSSTTAMFPGALWEVPSNALGQHYYKKSTQIHPPTTTLFFFIIII